jgi:hypothetical protein
VREGDAARAVLERGEEAHAAAEEIEQPDDSRVPHKVQCVQLALEAPARADRGTSLSATTG